MWITYSVLSLFQFLFCLVKVANHYEVHVIFRDIENQLRENVFYTVFIIVFFIKYSFSWEVSLVHSKLFTGSFWDNAHSCKLFAYQYWIYDKFLFLSRSFRYFLLAFAYR